LCMCYVNVNVEEGRVVVFVALGGNE
jgi:hypothetical protein